MIKIENNIVEEIVALLANLQCGVQAKNMTVGLLYAYLIMQMNQQTNEGENPDHGESIGTSNSNRTVE